MRSKKIKSRYREIQYTRKARQELLAVAIAALGTSAQTTLLVSQSQLRKSSYFKR